MQERPFQDRTNLGRSGEKKPGPQVEKIEGKPEPVKPGPKDLTSLLGYMHLVDENRNNDPTTEDTGQESNASPAKPTPKEETEIKKTGKGNL